MVGSIPVESPNSPREVWELVEKLSAKVSTYEWLCYGKALRYGIRSADTQLS